MMRSVSELLGVRRHIVSALMLALFSVVVVDRALAVTCLLQEQPDCSGTCLLIFTCGPGVGVNCGCTF